MPDPKQGLNPSHKWVGIDEEEGMFCEDCHICTCHSPRVSTQCEMNGGL